VAKTVVNVLDGAVSTPSISRISGTRAAIEPPGSTSHGADRPDLSARRPEVSGMSKRDDPNDPHARPFKVD
jgi:hypothetical protein